MVFPKNQIVSITHEICKSLKNRCTTTVWFIYMLKPLKIFGAIFLSGSRCEMSY